MRFKNKKASVLKGLVIRIKPIRYEGELSGFEVSITQANKSVKYIYQFPASRTEVFKAVLTQIGNTIEYPYSRRRQAHTRTIERVSMQRTRRSRLR